MSQNKNYDRIIKFSEAAVHRQQYTDYNKGQKAK